MKGRLRQVNTLFFFPFFTWVSETEVKSRDFHESMREIALGSNEWAQTRRHCTIAVSLTFATSSVQYLYKYSKVLL